MLNKAYYSKALLIAISCGAMASLTSGTALAGFEWVPGTPQAPAQKAQSDNMQIRQAPVPNVTNEQLSAPAAPQAPTHPDEIIHVAPQTMQHHTPAPAASDVMTPSPFDTADAPAAPAPSPAPQTTINTIDFTNKAPAQDTNNEILEPIEAQSLNVEEETIALPTAETAAPESITTAPATQEAVIMPAAQQPQQLVPSLQEEEGAARLPTILAYPETTSKPAATQDTPAIDEPVYAEAIGFGKDMPLALAVQQILPPGYAFSFAKSVNPGERVSWNGGQQWNVVLLETLETLGLSARIQGNSVVIVPAVDELSAIGSGATAAPSVEQDDTSDIVTIEPASGTEQQAAPTGLGDDGGITTKRLIIRDPGERETGQPGLSKSALLKPALKRDDSLILQDEGINDVDKATVQNARAASAHTWTAQNGDSLKKVMYDWAKKADIQIIWEASHDYTLNADFASSEPVNKAMENLIKSALQNDAIPSYRMLNSGLNKNQMALIIIQDPAETEMAESAPTAG